MNNIDYQETISKMVSSIQNNIRKIIQTETKCDQTYTCKVTEVIAADKVKIKHNSSEYTASTSVYCEVGDMVRVTAPCGNLEDMFVVENKSRGKTIRDLKASVGTLADDHSALKTDFINSKTDIYTKLRKTTMTDTRSTNQTPDWYRSTYGMGVIYEFKSGDSINVGISGYVVLATLVPWPDSSGGDVIQIALSGTTIKKRSGTSDSWGSWS